jgi:hypothetical protein
MNPTLWMVLSIALAIAVVCVGCRSAAVSGGGLIGAHDLALARSAPADVPPPPAGSETEKAAVARFVDFYREYSTASIRRGVRDLYAYDAYFGDPFKGVTGIDAIEAYFLRMAEPVVACTFVVTSVSRTAEGEYFIPWVMDLTVKHAKKNPLRALGVSHVRFNAQGQVIFQQDYWDSSVLFERLPVVGVLTRYVKRRLED